MSNVPERCSPVLGKGPRLFAGDYYVITRKYGELQKQLAQALIAEPMIFTVTGVSEGFGSSFVRVHYHCPKGVYVDSRRAENIEIADKPIILPTHNHLVITRKIGTSFLIRPFRGKEEQAATELFDGHVSVRPEEDYAKGDHKIHVYASDCWEILRTELVPGSSPTVLSGETDGVSLSAFRCAAERVLNKAQLEEITEVARSLARR